MPSMSCHTSTWPSVPAPAPIPIVGTSSAAETRAATGAGTASRTIANAPASCSASASSKSCFAAVARPALSLEAAELRGGLRRQADVAHDPDVRVGDRAHAREHPAGALELDDVRAALLDHPDRARDRLLVRDLVGAERQVADDERPPRRAGDRARQEDHLVERDRQRRLVAEHHHRGRVADEDQLDARLVRDPGCGCVVGGDHHDLVVTLLHLEQLGQRQLPGCGRGGRGGARAGAHDAPFRETLSIRRTSPIRAASARVGPSRSATST